MSGRTTLEDLRVRFETQRITAGKAKGTIAQERTTLRQLCRAWDKTRRAPGSLDSVWMEDFLYGPEGRAKTVQPSTFNKNLSHIQAFVRWLIRRDVLRNDILDVMFPLPTGRREFVRLSADELTRMIEDAKEEWERFVLSLAVFTLGRWSELRIVQLRHVNLDGRYIQWWREKTDEWDELPITAELDREIRRWLVHYESKMGRPLRPEDYLIPMRVPAGWNCPGQDLKFHGRWAYVADSKATESIRKCVKRAAAPVVGGMDLIKGQAVHLIRRSAARELYEALKRRGIPDPIRIVMAMLGHKRVQTTEIYLGIERDRENRDNVLRGASLLGVDRADVVELKAVASGR